MYPLCLPSLSQDFEQCGAEYQSLSNQDYYSQLEALKRMHLQNIAHLDVMYLNELSASKGKASQEAQMSDKDEIDGYVCGESEHCTFRIELPIHSLSIHYPCKSNK